MNLRDISRVVESLPIREKFLDYEHTTTKVSRLNRFRQIIESLDGFPGFEEDLELLRCSAIFSHESDELILKGGGWELYQAAERIRLGLIGVEEVLGKLIPPPSSETVTVKLPPCSEFFEVIQCLNSIEKALSQNVVNDDIHGVVQVKSWQPGSLWIDIFLGTAEAVVLVGGIAWSAAVVRKKRHEGRIMEKIADSMEIKNQMLENIRIGVESHVQMTIESEARNLASHNFKKHDNNEQVERLKLGIKTFADLIERGAEIHPALQAPEDVRNLFPDFKFLDTIETKTKQLQATSGDSK